MADDMGFSDMGVMGSEINTPVLNTLAEKGILYTQFYNGARCCPTRASLLTGLYPHQAGMGWMTVRDLGTYSYTDELNHDCVTIAEVLKKTPLRTVIKMPGLYKGGLNVILAPWLVMEVITLREP